MNKSTPCTIPRMQPGYGYTMYHQNIFAALVKAAENYRELWVEMENRCKTPLDTKLAAGSDDIEEAAIPVILLAHAMVEALANWYLAMSCPSERFAKIEKKGLLKKWTTFAKECTPGYELPEDHDVHRDLSDLISRRAMITHHKPFVEANDQVVHEGDHKKMMTADLDFVKRVASLPTRLVDHVRACNDATYLHMTRFSLDDARTRVLRAMKWERHRDQQR